MRYFSTLFLIAASASVVLALPNPQVVNKDANERANDGSKAVENEFKIQESIALTNAGCAGAVVQGAKCEAIDADFQAKLAAAEGTDAAAAKDAAAGDKAVADKAAADNKNQNKDQNKDKQN